MNTLYLSYFTKRAIILMALISFFGSPKSLKAQLSGTQYTIDNSSAASANNYRNFQSFFNDIWNGTRSDGGPTNGPGISASVEVNVASSQTFNEQVRVRPHSSLNANRRVVIKGNNALLSWNGNSSNRHTLWLDGADYFTFDGLRVHGTNSLYVYTVRLSNRADYNIFKNCELAAPNANYTSQTITRSATNTTTNFSNTTRATAVVAFTYETGNLRNGTGSNNGRGNLFENNKILGPPDNANLRGPTYGVFEQSNATTTVGENEFIGNEIKNFGGIGIYAFRASAGKYNFNTITRNQNSIFQNTSTQTYCYGIWIHYPYLRLHTNKEVEIIGNTITGIGKANTSNTRYFYGIAVSRTNGTTGSYNSGGRKIRIERNLIANNYTGLLNSNSFYFYGIYTYYAAQADIINNIVANNKPVRYANSLNYYYHRPIYAFYSRGGDMLHNTIYDSHHAHNNNSRYYNYGMYQSICCANQPQQDQIHINNNAIYADITPSSIHYDNYLYYWRYAEEAKNNVVYNGGGRNNRLGYMCRISSRSGTCSGYAMTGGEMNSETDAEDNFEADPNFVDPDNLDFAFTNPDLNANALQSDVTEDFYGNPRNPNFPDIGAVEVDFDYAISGDFNGGDYSLCGAESRPLTVTVQNLMPFNLPNPRVGYRLNNNPIVFKTEEMLPANGTVDITFDEDVDLTGAAGNSVLQVFIAHPDDNNANDTLTFNLTVVRGPYGGVLTVNPNTMGLAPEGDRTHWITIPDDPIIFNITSPSNYANNRYGQDYTAVASARTVNSNITLPASASVYSHNMQTGGTWTINFPEAFVDSMIEIELKLSDFNTGCDTFVRRRVLVAPFGKPDFKIPSNICVGNQVELENEATVQSGYLEYEWDFGNGVTSKQTNGRPVFMTPGNYQVTLLTRTVPYGFIKTITKTVTVNEGPIASFEYQSNCFGSPVVLNNTTQDNGTPSYLWDFGNGQTSTAVNPSLNYSTPGLYTVRLTASRNGCVTEAMQEVAQFEQPVADFNLSAGSCQNSTFSFDNLTGNISGKVGYLWSYGEGDARSTEIQGSHVYRTVGIKTVSLKVSTALGCVDSISKTIQVVPGPSGDFSITGSCQDQEIAFASIDQAMGQNAVYAWTIDGESFSSGNVNRTYSVVGDREATLTVSYGNGCSNTVSREFAVQPKPVADFSHDLLCSDREVVLDNRTRWTDGQIRYTWDLGDGNTSDRVHARHIYNVSADTDMEVVLMAEIEDGCSDEVRKTVRVNVSPKRCDFEMEADYASGFRFMRFVPTDGNNTGAESGVTYTWYYGDNTEETIASEGGRDYASDGSYRVTMRAERASGCFCESTQMIVVDRLNVNQPNADGMQFHVYPSPNNGSFQVEIASGNGEGVVTVLDAIGNEVYRSSESKLQIAGNRITLQGVSAGLYFVRYTSGTVQQVRKIQILD